VVAVTSTMTADILLRGQLAQMRESGFEVWLMCQAGGALEAIGAREGVRTVGIDFEREMNPRSDARALWQVVRALRAVRPDAVHASTPKAGLLVLLAARMVGVPVRVYLVRGLRLETARGWKRRVLWAAERMAIGAATQVHAVSDSLRTRMVELGLAEARQVQVLGRGSSRGVDVERFAAAAAEAVRLRAEVGIAEGAPVIGFVGRLTRDKGVGDFHRAFEKVAEVLPAVRGLVLGDAEPGDPVGSETLAWLRDDPRVIQVGHVEDPAPYYHLMSMLAFPSYREGFPNAPLEAAACGVPTVGYRATGVVDAVVDGETGTLVELGDVEALADAMVLYLSDGDLRQTRGGAARARARAEFAQESVWSHHADALWQAVRSRRQC